jgi:hypothetical protein
MRNLSEQKIEQAKMLNKKCVKNSRDKKIWRNMKGNHRTGVTTVFS